MIKAVESATLRAGDTVETAPDTVAITTRLRRRSTPSSAWRRAEIPYSQRDRQCPDATDVLCVTHRRSSIYVLAERWPPRRVEFRDGNRRSRAVRRAQ